MNLFFNIILDYKTPKNTRNSYDVSIHVTCSQFDLIDAYKVDLKKLN